MKLPKGAILQERKLQKICLNLLSALPALLSCQLTASRFPVTPGMFLLTENQVIALAPDPAAAQAGRTLANARYWLRLGLNEQAAWGECQGSGKLPYQTRIDLQNLAFHCSCPSRKFPCKHGLGLGLLLAAGPQQFSSGEPPEWVRQWLLARQQKAERKGARGTVQPDSAAATRKYRRVLINWNYGYAICCAWGLLPLHHGTMRSGTEPQPGWSMRKRPAWRV